jgi:phage-related holin
MRQFLEAIGLSIVAVFLPIKAILFVMLVLVIADFITGIYAAIKAKRLITSAGLKRTVGKFLIYELSVCLAFLVHQYLIGDLIPAEKIIASAIGLTELKSILENLDEITGQNTFQALLNRISAAQKDSNSQ